MGLLDMFGGMSPDQGQGLLSAGLNMMAASGPSRQPSNFGTAALAGLQGYTGTMADIQKRKRQEEEDKLMQQYKAMQMAEMQQKIAARTALQNQTEGLTNFYKSRGQNANPEVQAMAARQSFMGGDLRPIVENAERLGQMPPAQAQASSLYNELLGEARELQKAGFVAQAEAKLKEAISVRPKFSLTPQNLRGKDGQLAPYQLSDDGAAPRHTGLGVGPDMVEIGLGNRKIFEDKNAMRPGQSYQIGQSPDSAASERSASANRAQSERHFNANQGAPQYMETTQGIVALPKRLGAGQTPTGQLVMGPNGQQLEKKVNLPQYVVEGVTGNAKTISAIDSAILALEAPGGKNAVGWKGYLPNPILNRAYPDGTETRANIADVGSLTIHDRSGAAVTAAESPRLMPFIPLTTDDDQTALKKLKRMKQIAEAETNNLTFQFPQARGLADYSKRGDGSQTGGASGDWDDSKVVDFGSLK